MEREAFYSGYCRQLDGPRRVCAVAQDTQLTETDCLYPDCPYAPDCPIAEQIRLFLTGPEEK